NGITTFGPQVTITGQSGEIQTQAGGNFVNQGMLGANVLGGTITVLVPNWINAGVLDSENGGALQLSSDWTNISTASPNILLGVGSSIHISGEVTTPAGSSAPLTAVASSAASVVDLSNSNVS